MKTPKGSQTRPTTDRIKETLFNILQPYLADCVFVDLFSGSGGIGIEALSRGSRKCYFVDNEKEALSCIQENLAFTKFTEQSVVLKQDAVSALHSIFEKEVDVIFMDPPYQSDLVEKVFFVLKDMKYVTENTLIVAEALLDADFSFLEAMGFEVSRQKKYKTNQHFFIYKAQKQSEKDSK